MTAVAVPLTDVDDNIRDAWIELLAARHAWARSPNADSIHAAACAEARVNRLLELRYRLSQ